MKIATTGKNPSPFNRHNPFSLEFSAYFAIYFVIHLFFIYFVLIKFRWNFVDQGIKNVMFLVFWKLAF